MAVMGHPMLARFPPPPCWPMKLRRHPQPRLQRLKAIQIEPSASDQKWKVLSISSRWGEQEVVGMMKASAPSCSRQQKLHGSGNRGGLDPSRSGVQGPGSDVHRLASRPSASRLADSKQIPYLSAGISSERRRERHKCRSGRKLLKQPGECRSAQISQFVTTPYVPPKVLQAESAGVEQSPERSRISWRVKVSASDLSANAPRRC